MPDLAAFQAAFADKLMQSSPVRDGLAVYRNNWLCATTDALADLYPTVHRLVGNEAFEGVALDYARHDPPASPILSRYGADFPDFLCDQAWVEDLPYLPDVAAIDRLYLEALLAADAPPLDPATLAAIAPTDWATLRLGTHPAMRIGWFTTPAPSIWLAHRDGDPGELAPEWRAEGILLTRPGLSVEARAIDRAEHRLLFGMRLGETVGEAALATANLYPTSDFAGLFARTLESGAIAAQPN
ncbi:DNA-binding domain-containing protein [Sphingomonas tabacisoli]|uniref:DNA-binding domain-containing protein n=1 Tax=Sphingomonas tabacisoli TaxID=2249466 RepID=A0ABW4I4J5_9SPHN